MHGWLLVIAYTYSKNLWYALDRVTTSNSSELIDPAMYGILVWFPSALNHKHPYRLLNTDNVTGAS